MTANILFLIPYPISQAPSQRFRFEQYWSVLDQNHFRYTVRPFFSKKGYKLLYKSKLKTIFYTILGFTKRLFTLLSISKYDYVFIHREAAPLGPPAFEWLIAKVFGKKIIYDFDDAIWLEDPDEKGSLISKLKFKSKIAKICRWSCRISVGNEYLAQFALQWNSNVVINPTTIDTIHLHNTNQYKTESKNSNSKKVVIGWTGTHSTLQYLKPLIPIFKRLEANFDFTFLIIANEKPDFDFKSMSFVRWRKDTEIDDLMKIDIGVMPLTDDAWSKGKCGFKLLQYMALEKPAIASPVGVNTDIIIDGENGLLCHSAIQWEERLGELINDESLRIKMGKAGRKVVEKNYSVDSNQANFLSLFE